MRNIKRRDFCTGVVAATISPMIPAFSAEQSSDQNLIFTKRRTDFESIRTAIKATLKWQDDRCLLAEGDSLAVLKQIPSNSIGLIVTDPPYHSTKKSNIIGDTAFKDNEEYLQWLEQYFLEWKRILKPNGSIYCFCSSKMSAQIEVRMAREFQILTNITWTKPNDPGFDGWKQKAKKESFREWYDQSEHIIFATPACPGNLFNSYFGNELRRWRTDAKMSMKDLAEIIGAYGKVNHGGSVANWEAGRNIPSEEQYLKIKKALKPLLHYELPEYVDVIRPFYATKDGEFTDIWQFPTIRPYKNKHPAEKPIPLLEHAIRASSNKGDIVLDCFAGSGTTAIAALKNSRLAISIEIDEKWIKECERKFTLLKDSSYKTFPNNYHPNDVLGIN